jgi:hypothetical protein
MWDNGHGIVGRACVLHADQNTRRPLFRLVRN